MTEFFNGPFIYGPIEEPTPLFLGSEKELHKCKNPKGCDSGCLDCSYQYHYDMEEHCKNPMDI
jgi:hypothetical protein